MFPACSLRTRGASWDSHQTSGLSRICATLLRCLFIVMWLLTIFLTLAAVLSGLLIGVASPFMSPFERMQILLAQIFAIFGIIFCVTVGFSTFFPRMILLSVIPESDGSVPIIEDLKFYRKLWRERRAARGSGQN